MPVDKDERLRLMRVDIEIALLDLAGGYVSSARHRLNNTLAQEFRFMTEAKGDASHD